MAARNPSSYTTWIDERVLEPSKPILSSTVDAVLDDQEYILDQPVLIVSYAGYMKIETAGSGSFVTNDKLYVKNKDMCDVSGITNNEIECDVYAYAVCNDSLVTGEIRLTSTATSNSTSTITVPAGASPTWIQGDTMNIKTNDVEDQITIDMRITNTNTIDEVVLLSLAIIAKET